jgi:hypothetical protein
MNEAFGAEIRLETGQLARMVDGGTVQVIKSPEELPPPAKFYFRMTATHKDDLGKARPLYDAQGNMRRPTQAASADYDALIAFMKQLEGLGYTLTNIERVIGEFNPS